MFYYEKIIPNEHLKIKIYGRAETFVTKIWAYEKHRCEINIYLPHI